MTNRQLFFRFTLLCLPMVLAICTMPTFADSSIDVATHSLLPDTPNQPIEIYVAGDDQVRGMNVRAQIGDGAGPQVEPVFEGIDFTGGIWDGQPSTVLGGVVGDGQYVQSGIAFDETGTTVTSNGLLVRLSVSTVGVHEGSYPLLLTKFFVDDDTQLDTDFIVVGGDSFVPQIANGTVAIIPEPGGLLSLVIGGIIALGRRRNP